jgi:DNA-binding MarR family transcriptional regulator
VSIRIRERFVKQEHELKIQSLATKIKKMSSSLKYNTGLQLMYTGLLMDRYINLKASEYDQNRSRLDIMHTLITHEGVLKPSDISKMTFRTKQAVTKVVDGLINDGLVTREPEGKDRRTKKVIITGKGVELVMKSLPTTKAISQESMPALTTNEMKQLNDILKQVRNHILEQMAIVETNNGR